VTHIPNIGRYEFSGDDIGVVILGNSESFPKLTQSLVGEGLKVLNQNATDKNSYEFAERQYLDLKSRCTKIYIASFFDAAHHALALAQNYSNEISGLILIEPKLLTNRFLKSSKEVQNNLYLVDQPTLLLYPNPENGASAAATASLYIADEISAPFIKEVLLEISFSASDNDLPLLIDEALFFVDETKDNSWIADGTSDDVELIDAEFQSIVAGLSLDESTPNTYLDQLNSQEEERFQIPNPELLPIRNRSKRNAIFFMVVGPAYALATTIIGFNPSGIEPWPGVLAFIGGLAYFLHLTRDDFNDDDGAVV